MERPEYIHERMGGQLHPGDIARYALVPGSRKRLEALSETWDQKRKLASHYEFLVYSGEMDGIPLSACSTGIGSRSTSIAIDELAALGADTFIRCGVTGAIQPEIKAGDLIIASAAVRMDKTSEHYIPVEYPAVADFEVVCALIEAAEKFGYRYHVGVVATASSFYAGEGTSGFQGYRHSGMDHIVSDLQAAKVLDWDTETAVIFTLCSLYGLRAGRINVVVDDPVTGTYDPSGEPSLVQTTLEAIRILAEWDKKKINLGSRYTLPSDPSA
jgi:uridine phosphorylase